MAHRTSNVVYGIIEREFVTHTLTSDEVIIKIGHTTKPFHKRLSNYPNGSQMVFAIGVQRNKSREAEKCLLNMLRHNDDVIERKDIGTEYFEIDQSMFPNVVLQMQTAMYHKFLWKRAEANGDDATSDESDTEVREEYHDVREEYHEVREEYYEDPVEREGIVSQLCTEIIRNVVEANKTPKVPSVIEFVAANIEELSEKVVKQTDILRRIQTSVEGKTTSNKTLAVLKDLGAKQVRYMFEEAFPIPAVQFPDLKKHDKIKLFAMSVTDAGQKFVSIQEVFYGFKAFCSYRGESTPAANDADMEKLMRECGVDPEILVGSYNITITDWLNEVLEVTGIYSDYVNGGALKKMWVSAHGVQGKGSAFTIPLLNAYINGLNQAEKDPSKHVIICGACSSNVVVDKRTTTKRHVYKGIAFK